jgi:hypothetical protein
MIQRRGERQKRERPARIRGREADNLNRVAPRVKGFALDLRHPQRWFTC